MTTPETDPAGARRMSASVVTRPDLGRSTVAEDTSAAPGYQVWARPDCHGGLTSSVVGSAGSAPTR